MIRAFARRRRPRERRSVLRKAGDIALTLALFGLLALVAARFETGPKITAEGAARIADGDSLEIDGQRIRLAGIDAPELDQSCRRGDQAYDCGREARKVLVDLAGQVDLACEGNRYDRYDRLLAQCSAGGRNLNEQMVALGWAVAYGDYGDAERQARQARRGLWAGEFERPQDWRRMHGGLAEAPHDALAGIGDWLRGLLSGMVSGQE